MAVRAFDRRAETRGFAAVVNGRTVPLRPYAEAEAEAAQQLTARHEDRQPTRHIGRMQCTRAEIPQHAAAVSCIPREEGADESFESRLVRHVDQTQLQALPFLSLFSSRIATYPQLGLMYCSKRIAMRRCCASANPPVSQWMALRLGRAFSHVVIVVVAGRGLYDPPVPSARMIVKD